MKIFLFLAFCNIIRKKLRSIVMLLGISSVLMMAISFSIIQEYSISQNKNKVEQNYGNWQICFLANDDNAITQAQKSGISEKVFTGYRFQPVTINDDVISLDLSIISGNGLPYMAPNLTKGRYPSAPNEIIVQDWYLRKNNITGLPADITAGNNVFHITGAIKSVDELTDIHTLKAFGLLSSNM